MEHSQCVDEEKGEFDVSKLESMSCCALLLSEYSCGLYCFL